MGICVSHRLTDGFRQLLSDRFVWSGEKPEPFGILRGQATAYWKRGESESRGGFIDRMHAQWEELEQETRREILELRSTQASIRIGNDGEVEYVDFVWRRRNVRCETFRKVDLSNPKDGFKSSKILDNFERKMADYDRKSLVKKKIRAQVLQYIVAKKAMEASAKLASGEQVKKLIEGGYETMDSLERDEWRDWIANEKRDVQTNVEYKKYHSAVIESWESWGSGGKEWT